MGQDQPFYGFQSAALESQRDPATQIALMASHYLEELRLVQPEGPYYLGGWSMGGVVAFEMARQLEAQGQRVALLALMDASAPDPSRCAETDELTLIASFAQDMGLSLDQLAISEDELRRLGPDEQLTYLLEQASLANVLPPDIELAQIRRLFDVFMANVQAMLSYVPQPYAGRVTLFRAVEDSAGGRGDASFGWANLALEGVALNEAPGTHFTMVRQPHVQVLAERLRAALGAAIEEYADSNGEEAIH
jgi:thioesterase domain-containing protein